MSWAWPYRQGRSIVERRLRFRTNWLEWTRWSSATAIENDPDIHSRPFEGRSRVVSTFTGFLLNFECRLTLTGIIDVPTSRSDPRPVRRKVIVVACRSENLTPTRARKMKVRTRIRASAWSTKGWSFGVPVAYFDSVLRTEGALGEAITCLLVAVDVQIITIGKISGHVN